MFSPSKERTLHQVNILKAAYAALPTSEDLKNLIEDSNRAQARAYFNPVEDERLRESYTRYLAIRSTLWSIVQDNRDASRRIQKANDKRDLLDLEGFAIAFCAAEIIVRSGEYLIDLARDKSLVWKKLNEADARYGLKRKSFTRIYRQLTSASKMRGFYKACDFFDENRDLVLQAAPDEVRAILLSLNLPTASRGDHLKRYRQFLRHSLKRRHISAWKNIVFSIFEMMGSDIADLKIPLVKPPMAPKRVTSDIIETVRDVLQPGDVFVTRHDDAMSNVFLPGFWPHSALWLGDTDNDILEAKKDGVLFRDVEETLQVDAFTIIRPKLPSDVIIEALNRGKSHEGKLYDFIFDFRTTDRLVCTEVIYRTYHGIGGIDFKLIQQAGRYCLSAEELLNQGIENDWFEVVAIYGVNGDKLYRGDTAKSILRESFKSRF